VKKVSKCLALWHSGVIVHYNTTTAETNINSGL